jgi:hypothetical protein
MDPAIQRISVFFFFSAPTEAYLIFKLLNKSGSGYLSLDEFYGKLLSHFYQLFTHFLLIFINFSLIAFSRTDIKNGAATPSQTTFSLMTQTKKGLFSTFTLSDIEPK